MCRPKHVEQLRNIGIINSTAWLHLVGSFYEICIYVFLVVLGTNPEHHLPNYQHTFDLNCVFLISNLHNLWDLVFVNFATAALPEILIATYFGVSLKMHRLLKCAYICFVV